MNGHTQTRFGEAEKKRLKTQSLTDYGEIDAAVAGRRSFKIDAASVETNIRFVHVVDHQTSGRRSVTLQFAEKSSFAQHIIIGPMSRPTGVFIPSVVPANGEM